MKRTGELINFIALKESKVSTRKLGASFPTIGSISLAAEAREVKGEIKIKLWRVCVSLCFVICYAVCLSNILDLIVYFGCVLYFLIVCLQHHHAFFDNNSIHEVRFEVINDI